MSIQFDMHRGTVVALNCCLIELVFMPVSAPISRKGLMLQTITEIFGELWHTLAKQLPAPAKLVLYRALLACVLKTGASNNVPLVDGIRARHKENSALNSGISAVLTAH